MDGIFYKDIATTLLKIHEWILNPIFKIENINLNIEAIAKGSLKEECVLKKRRRREIFVEMKKS